MAAEIVRVEIVKSVHMIFAFAWFAGLFYLPRLLVYHAQAKDAPGRTRFYLMEKRLFWIIMTPAMLMVLATGIWLWAGYGYTGGWLHVKAGLAALLVLYQLWCRREMARLARKNLPESGRFYRFMNEVPTLFLIALIFLVELKPF